MTRRETCDIVILGAGFGGSLLAQIARTADRRVVLLESKRHPRFAIGESSTPLANLKLEMLADRYGLTAIKPLCKYGPWKRTYPQIACGLKRGFSFFHHRRDEPFEPDANHANELLVAANPSAEQGDTHWYRADFDAFMVTQAQEAGVVYIDRCEVAEMHHGPPWKLRGRCEDGPIEVSASFLVDATGNGRLLGDALRPGDVTDALRRGACSEDASSNRAATVRERSFPDSSAPLDRRESEKELFGMSPTDATNTLRTRTSGLFGHFRDVALWSDVLRELGGSIDDHPYPCDAAALHHVIEGGWMWVLRFDNGITSAGFSLDPQVHPPVGHRSPEAQWEALLAAYPSIARQFRAAAPVRPLVRVERLQRRWSETVGEDWAMLPHTAGFVDPWFSSGIAQTLFGIERLARVLTDGWAAPDRTERLAAYGNALARVFDLADSLIAACLKSFDRFDVMVSLTMAYFAAAIYSEERIRAGLDTPDDEFLLAHDQRFRAIAAELCESAAKTGPTDAVEFARRTAELLAPYNTAGLCDPARRNMYPYTSTV